MVQVFLSDADINTLSQTRKSSDMDSMKQEVKLSKTDIVFEDKSLLVINKSPGLNVHPGDHKTKEVSLIQQAQSYLSSQNLNSLTFKPSLIHRIDRDTSGIIMIAKDKQTLTKLGADFKRKSHI